MAMPLSVDIKVVNGSLSDPARDGINKILSERSSRVPALKSYQVIIDWKNPNSPLAKIKATRDRVPDFDKADYVVVSSGGNVIEATEAALRKIDTQMQDDRANEPEASTGRLTRVGGIVAAAGASVLLLKYVLSFLLGSSGFAAVSGTITLDGKPVSGASVFFVPSAGSDSASASQPFTRAFGTTDSRGNYVLYYARAKTGARVGEYDVKISKITINDQQDKPVQGLPAKYNEDSNLKAVVKTGANQLSFDLESR